MEVIKYTITAEENGKEVPLPAIINTARPIDPTVMADMATLVARFKALNEMIELNNNDVTWSEAFAMLKVKTD